MTSDKKTIRLDETTRMRVLDLGDKQICIRVETRGRRRPGRRTTRTATTR